MRRWQSIARATAVEILSEPLSLLVLIASVVLAVLAPAFHYHQFGEATRMARDAGFSSLFTGGAVIAVFATIRSFRREVESGTIEMALSRPVSRSMFFLAKTSGAAIAYLLFAATVLTVTASIVHGAAVGGEIARQNGDVARLWGPDFAAGTMVVILPLVVAALLNRFGRFRFCLSAFLLAPAVAVLTQATRIVSPAVSSDVSFVRLLSVAIPVVSYTLVLLSASAAFSVRLRANAAASAAGLVFALSLPFVGNFYLPEALSNGGALSWRYVTLASLMSVLASTGFLVLGSGWEWRSGKVD